MRRQTIEVSVGDLKIGSGHPIVVQTMTNRPTADVEGCVDQILRAAEAGAQIVRLTAQGSKEVEALKEIKAKLLERGCNVPLCADIHFNAELAVRAANYVEKVRINPGNFAPEDRLEEKFLELLAVCRERNVALRVGVNHGSLSQRMIEKWGNTPRGMVNSALEFLSIAKREGFMNIAVSLKSSNPVVMVESYRLAAKEMDALGLNYPLHLGVTEAGEGEDGRVRSAVGIGALLCDGIGDTIRVSLTEEPECEIPVAKILADYYSNSSFVPTIKRSQTQFQNPAFVPVVVAKGGDFEQPQENWIFVDDKNYKELDPQKTPKGEFVVVECGSNSWTEGVREIIYHLREGGVANPIILRRNYTDSGSLAIVASADMGSILIDGLAQGVWIELQGQTIEADLPLSILQATRQRISRTEIISCPGCGRTLFDLQGVTQKVKERFKDFPGLKIAVMGCIVNGPGEMADAHYGYVGEGRGRVSIYRGQSPVLRGVLQEEALDRLEELIQSESCTSPSDCPKSR